MSDRASPRPSRRGVLALGVGAFVVASIPLAARGRRGRVVRRRVPLMGTIADVAVVHDREAEAQAAIGAALDRLHAVERAMTRYSDASDVGRVNAAAGGDPVVVSAETARVVEDALRWAEATDGAFDPCIGRVMDVWDVGHRTVPPSADDVRFWSGRRLFSALEVGGSRGASVVGLRHEAASLDLGGIAKGHGVDEAVRALREHGVERGFVNVGGDLYAMGTSEDGDPWAVGVQDPDDPSATIATLRVEDAAVATSGTYVRFFRHAGRRWHHLLDPGSAAPWAGPRQSLTVQADDVRTADAAATACFGMAVDRAAAVLRGRAPSARVVHSA